MALAVDVPVELVLDEDDEPVLDVDPVPSLDELPSPQASVPTATEQRSHLRIC